MYPKDPSPAAVDVESDFVAPRHNAGRRAVLVVDNDQVTVTTLALALSATGCRVRCATSPMEARSLLLKEEYHLAVVSLAGDGLRFMMEVIRESAVPAVAVVGGRGYFPVNYQLRMATVLGALGTLVKPVTAVRAKIVVGQALSGVGALADARLPLPG